MPVLELASVASWERPLAPGEVEGVARALEEGSVVVLPRLRVELEGDEGALLHAGLSDGRAKNVSLDPETGRLSGVRRDRAEEWRRLLPPMRRFAAGSARLARAVYPSAREGRTSFRPVEAAGRARSWRTDDQRLHVDAFPTRPTGGDRILRVFTNLHPDEPRVWRLGEPFETVLRRFGDSLREPSTAAAPVAMAAALALQVLGITHGRRSPYDQLMLRLHDAMKRDAAYQSGAPATILELPPGATWLAFTDQVSHAVVSGALAFEQTLLVPTRSLRDPASAPLAVLARARPHLHLPAG